MLNDRIPNSLPFLMSRIVGKLMEHCREFAEMGLSVPEARTLIVVLENPGVRVSDLSELTTIELSRLSHMLKRLEKAGHLRRKRLDTDSRSYSMNLTASGRSLALRCEKASIRHEGLLLQNLGDEDVALVRRIIRKISDGFESKRPTSTKSFYKAGRSQSKMAVSEKSASKKRVLVQTIGS